MKTKVKICGLRRREDARLATELGVWAVGFIFHRSSPRYIEPEDAQLIISGLSRDVIPVGVFVDWPIPDVNRVVDEMGLRAVQLHGEESPEYARAIRADEVWKAFRVGEKFSLESIDAYRECQRVLLDTFQSGKAGGTGETFDWNVARQAQERRPILLAGGIRPSNVKEALERVGPEGLDVSSGVEREPGVKDAAKLRELFMRVREHDEG